VTAHMYLHFLRYTCIVIDRIEKNTFRLDDFRIPRVLIASPGDFEVLRFNCNGLLSSPYSQISQKILINICMWHNCKH